MAQKKTDQDLLPQYSSDDEQQESKNALHSGGQAHGVHSSTFKDLLLKQEIIKALDKAAFEQPSEVQAECIPNAINGNDILCQAKSGMGKTSVYVLSILQQINEKYDFIFALVLVNKRELVDQILADFKRFSTFIDYVHADAFCGGEDLKEQVKRLKAKVPQVLIGTPGRILEMVQKGLLKFDKLKVFVIDECDDVFDRLEMRSDVQKIFIKTPHDKQVMMFSATINLAMRAVCRKFMQKQLEIFIDDDAKLTLHGLIQYYAKVEENQKTKKLSDILDAVNFNQAMIFVSTPQRANALCNILQELKFPATVMHSKMKNESRVANTQSFKKNQQKIMVCTDLFGRGIDFERVNLVVNYDMPKDSDKYLHRVNRAGRFGTKGLTVSFITSEEDNTLLAEAQKRFEVDIGTLPDNIDQNLYIN